MEKIVQQGILYDFYGELLTDHQKRVYESVAYENMSLGEIAGELGISRQAVHDLIKRTDKILQDYENKLGLIKKFGQVKDKVADIDGRLSRMNVRDDTEQGQIAEIRSLCSQIIELI